MMEAVLSNADHPEYGVATIPLPIPRNQYDHCVALLEALEIGDASEADCRVDSLDSAWPVLNRLVSTKVNLDELDYLAKRLDSFTVGEFSQFQAMVEKLHLTSMKDLINLTFCCQQATVITDFTNLKEVGRDHYMNIHGGCASMEELEQLDGVETAVLLIEDNEGTITRYGVVYDNGMQLSQLYDGKHLPCYHYEADMTAVGISSRWEPENSRNVTWIYLPASKGQIERAMQRSGIADPKDMRLFMADSSFPKEVDVALDFRCDNIYELNELALVADKLSYDDRRKLGAAVSMAIHDVSVAAYHAFRKQNISTDQRWERLLDKLDGKELTPSSEAMVLTGSRRLSMNEISFQDDMSECGSLLNFYVPVTFDPDAVFGTNVATDANDDYLNVYADFDLDVGEVCDALTVIQVCGDGSEETYRYPLTEEDRSILRAKMNDYCMEQTGLSLDDYRAQYLDEEMCASSFPDGQSM